MDPNVLAELEAQAKNLPPEEAKHDPQAEYAAIAAWLRSLDPGRRRQVLAALPAWYQDTGDDWHPVAALEIAVLLRDSDLLTEAVNAAQRIDIASGGDGSDGLQGPRLSFVLNLISALARMPTGRGNQYLRSLKARVPSAQNYNLRNVGIRASFTLCFIEDGDGEVACIDEGLRWLRRWKDEGLLRSGLTLLHHYYVTVSDRVELLRALLTPDEFAIACPELVIARPLR